MIYTGLYNAAIFVALRDRRPPFVDIYDPDVGASDDDKKIAKLASYIDIPADELKDIS